MKRPEPFAPLDIVERDIASVLKPFAAHELSASADARIRERMLSGLTGSADTTGSRGRRFLWTLGIVAPLMAVTAVGAAAGSSDPLPNVVEQAASAIGIGGNSGDVRQDGERRSEVSSDNGQPGSAPGHSGDAPGLTGKPREDDSTPSATGTPVPGGPAPTTAPESTKTPPHENGKGCDDDLFADGEPPFATPGGPVGCDVGNSGEHRKNGANATETPAPTGSTPSPAAGGDDDEDNGDEDSPGGTSHGLGNGHSDDAPGNGQGNGHNTHEHDPNENGNGPAGKDPSVTPSAGGSEAPASGPVTTPEPGNGNGNGNGKAKGKN